MKRPFTWSMIAVGGLTFGSHACAPIDPSGADPGHRPVEGLCSPTGHGDPFADCVEQFEPRNASHGHEELPDIVLGPPQPGEAGAGSTHVASLGCGGQITLYFDPPGIINRAGDDFVVYENPFESGDLVFAEPGEVSVSSDGERWATFPCELDGSASWPALGCAGVHPVAPDGSGGDAFDLAVVGLASATYVRIVDRSREYWGDETWCGGNAGGFDLDAVVAVEAGS